MEAAKEPRVTPGAAKPGLATVAAARHVDAAIDAADGVSGQLNKLREFFEQLAQPVDLTAEEARAVMYVAGKQRQSVNLDEEDTSRLVIPRNFSPRELGNLVLPGAPGPSVRRALYALAGEGVVEQDGYGHWRLTEPPEVSWPDTDRPAGWVIDKDGNGYAI